MGEMGTAVVWSWDRQVGKRGDCTEWSIRERVWLTKEFRSFPEINEETFNQGIKKESDLHFRVATPPNYDRWKKARRGQ